MKALRVATALAGFAALAAQAGPYDQPWAIFESGQPSEVRKEMRLAVTQVDGRSTRSARRTDPLSPGKHVLTLHVESARGIFRPQYLQLDVDAAPCTRYRLLAKYETTMGPDWKPRAHPEPIGECRRKFMKKDAPAK